MSLRLGIAGLLAALAAASPALALAPHGGEGSHAPSEPAQVVINATAVDPSHIAILAGERVEWHNASTRDHTITSSNGLFDSDLIASNRRFSQAFTDPGTFAYYCRIHPFIRGAVNVAAVLLRSPTRSLVRGDELVLEGRTRPVGGAVTIERASGSGFVPVTTVQPASDGSFSARLAADGSASFRAVAGTDVSAPVHVEVAAARTMKVSAARRRRSQVVRVAVSPPLRGAIVRLQYYIRHRFGWWTTTHARLEDGRSATIRLRRGSRARVRIVLTQPDGETSTAVRRMLKLPG